MESAVFDDLSKQLLDVVSYSMTLKNYLDRAEKNLVEIQSKRNSEIIDIYNKVNEEKLSLNSEISQLQREVVTLRDRNVELMKKSDSASANPQMHGDDFLSGYQQVEALRAQVQTLSKELASEKEKLRHEHHKVYKYEKEIQSVKDKHYEDLLNTYKQCEGIAMRHSRHQEIFNRLYKLGEDHQAGIKDDLDELTKYLKTREEKVSHLDKKWKKMEKDLDAERKQCQVFIKEVENATSAYGQSTKDNEQLKKEIDEMNSNFNKVYKEKTTDKMVFDNEMAKLQLEIKSLREQVPALKSTQAALSKNTATKDKFIVGVGITAA